MWLILLMNRPDFVLLHMFSTFLLAYCLAIITLYFLIDFQIAIEEKESILGGIPEECKEKGSLLYSSLIDEKVHWLKTYSQFIRF